MSAAFPELNTGVVLYKNTGAVLELIRQWDEMYRSEIASKKLAGVRPWHDQLSFTRAIYGSKLSFFMLPPEFNARVLMPQAVSGPIRIAHCRLKRPDRYEADLGKLNQSINPRNINPNLKRIPELVRRTLSLFLDTDVVETPFVNDPIFANATQNTIRAGNLLRPSVRVGTGIKT